MELKRLIVLTVLLFSFAIAQDEEFCPLTGAPPTEYDGNKMPQCCWYEDNTCCDEASMSLVAPIVEGAADAIYDLATDGGKNTNNTIEKCITYFENFMCFMCAPDFNTFFAINEDTGTVVIRLCNDFCDDFYDACSDKSLTGVTDFFKQSGINNGKDLCLDLMNIDADNYYDDGNDGNDDENSTAKQARKVLDEALPGIVIEVTDDECFEGVSSKDVGTAACTPWKGDYNDGGDGDDDDGFWWYWVFFVGAAIVVCGCLIVVAVIGGVIFYKKRQAGKVVTAGSSGDYPNLEELDEN